LSGSNGGTKPEATATPIRSRPCIHPRPLPRARRNNSYAGRRERDLLKSFYYFLHQSAPAGAAAPAGQSAAALAVAEAYRAAEWKQRRKGLEIALGFYREETGGRDAAGALSATLSKATDDQLALLEVQKVLERDGANAKAPPGSAALGATGSTRGGEPMSGGYRFVDTPLNETLYRCFCFGLDKHAEKVRSQFKVPDKRWWPIKVRGLAHAHAWTALWEFGASKKSPVGYGFFAEACAAQGAPREAARYAARMPAADAVALLVRLGLLDDARIIAAQHREKHPELLGLVASTIPRDLGART